jgi:hypothetical protein
VNPLDAELLPAPEVLGGLLDLDELFDPAGATAVTSIVCDLPVELAVHGADAGDRVERVVLSPPRQPIVTSVMPVLHRLRLTVVAHANG